MVDSASTGHPEAPGPRRSKSGNSDTASTEDVQLARSSWSQEVAARSIKLRDRISEVSEAVRPEIARRLDQADALCSTSSSLFSWGRFVDWWFGNRIEDAWTLLHNVELLIIDNSDVALLPILIEEAVNHAAVLDQTDPARVRLTQYVAAQTLPIGSQQ
jgi:hypothetical protein